MTVSQLTTSLEQKQDANACYYFIHFITAVREALATFKTVKLITRLLISKYV